MRRHVLPNWSLYMIVHLCAKNTDPSIALYRSEYNASEWTMYIVHGWGPDRQNGSRFWITDIVNDLLKLEVSGCDAFMNV